MAETRERPECPRCHALADKTHVCRNWDKERKKIEEPDPQQEGALKILEDLEW